VAAAAYSPAWGALPRPAPGKTGTHKQAVALLKAIANPFAHDPVLRQYGILRATDLFESQMDSGGATFRLKIARELVAIRSDRIQSHLGIWLRDPDPRIRAFAASNCDGPEPLDTGLEAQLIRLLQDPDYSVRAQSVAALGNWRCKAAVPGIIRLLRTAPSPLRKLAIQALGGIGDPSARGTLEAFAASGDDPVVMYTAAKALLRIQDNAPKVSAAAVLPTISIRTQ
jgi:HEAT repeat protein